MERRERIKRGLALILAGATFLTMILTVVIYALSA